MAINFEGYTRVSRDLVDYTPFRSHPSSLFCTYQNTNYDPTKSLTRAIFPAVMFPVHGLTHLEVPTPFLIESDKDIYTYGNVKLLDCIIVSVEDLQEVIDPYLQDKENVPFLKFELDFTMLKAIIENLKITKDYLCKKFQSLSETALENKFLIINTGWHSKYSPAVSSLDSPFFELFHAYLIHPYLTPEAINYLLLEKKIVGLGTDAPTLDIPLLYAERQHLFPLAEEFIKRFPLPSYTFETTFPKSIRDFIFQDHEQKFVERFYLKHLKSFDKRTSTVTSGELIIAPIYPFSDFEGVVAEVYFKEDNKVAYKLSSKPSALLDSYTRISMSMGEITSVRGDIDIKKFNYNFRGGRVLSTYFVPLHSPTHADIIVRDEKNNEMSQAENSPLNLQSLSAVLVDFRSKVDVIRTWLIPPDPDDPLDDIKPFINFRNDKVPEEAIKKITEIMESLKISKEELTSLLGDINLDNKMVIIRTDWQSAFKTSRDNFSSSVLELFHAYLCHPYIDLECAKYLLMEKNVRGIGIDTIGIRCPLDYIRFDRFFPLLKDIKKQYEDKIGEYSELEKIVRYDPRDSKPKLSFRNLTNLRLVDMKGEKFIEGELVIVPFNGIFKSVSRLTADSQIEFLPYISIKPLICDIYFKAL